MIRAFVGRGGVSELVDRLDPGWFTPGAGVTVWVDVEAPTAEDLQRIGDVFGFHPLALESVMTAGQHPKIETYDDYLYVVLHGINFNTNDESFDTHDLDFFLGGSYLVTVHDESFRSVAHVAALCARAGHVLGEGSVALLHRLVETMVEFYRPEIDSFEDRLDGLERRVVETPKPELIGDILAIKKDIAYLRRVVMPQRDVVARLARREFEAIDQEMAYRFRDASDRLTRMSEDTVALQDRVGGILDAHLAGLSNQMANVSRLLAVVAALFGPLTVITGIFGMNVPLPVIAGNEPYEFWEVLGLMLAATGGLWWWFKRAGWL